MLAARSLPCSYWRALLISIVPLATVTACVTPSAMHGSQTMPVRMGDSFQLLTAPTANGGYDAEIMRLLNERFAPDGKGTRWLVEYSYAVRPARLTMKSDSMDQSKAAPKSDVLLACKDTSHRLNVRLISSTDGAQAYRGTAEMVTCSNDPEQNGIVFNQLLNNALNGLNAERPAA